MILRGLIIVLLLGLVSCKKENEENTKVVRAYYQALNDSNYESMMVLIADSITTKEIDYVKKFAKNDYLEWMRWDSVFKPTYNIIEITEDNGILKTRVSKECRRTLFLNEAPVITKEVVTIKNGKVDKVEIVDYEVFNDNTWNKNRAELVEWIAVHHPELNGFLNDQTLKGALNYTKAITYFENKN